MNQRLTDNKNQNVIYTSPQKLYDARKSNATNSIHIFSKHHMLWQKLPCYSIFSRLIQFKTYSISYNEIVAIEISHILVILELFFQCTLCITELKQTFI